MARTKNRGYQQTLAPTYTARLSSLDSRPITHSTTSGSLFLYRTPAALGRALSRLYRAHDPGVPECTYAIRRIRAGVSGRYPFIPPVGRSVL